MHGGGGTPGIRVIADFGAAVATPTSEPFIDFNLWRVRSQRAKGQMPVWLSFALDNPSDETRHRRCRGGGRPVGGGSG
jgi:hypothetical protein